MPHGPLTKQETQAYRQRLQEIVARVGGDVGELRDEALRPLGAESPSQQGGDEADAGVRAANAELALDLLGPEEVILGEVNAALARIDQGTFGQCEACGKPVTRARLDALPYARQCVRCAHATEAEPTP